MSAGRAEEDARRVLVAGASGTIGRAVVKDLIEQGHAAIALLREGTGQPEELAGGIPVQADLADANRLATVMSEHRIDTVISCIASRSGSPKDAEAVDFRANLNLLNAAEQGGVDHFILLSAICVQRPLLAFQHAKIAFERALKASKIDHTIVRPTAFFKSLSGQIDRVLAGKPFLIFGNGELTRCKPISDADLARYIVDCMHLPERRGATLPIGGPGPAITLKRQGNGCSRPLVLSRASGLFRSGCSMLRRPSCHWVNVTRTGLQRKRNTPGSRAITRRRACWCLIRRPANTVPEATPEFGQDTLLEHYRSQIATRAGQGVE